MAVHEMVYCLPGNPHVAEISFTNSDMAELPGTHHRAHASIHFHDSANNKYLSEKLCAVEGIDRSLGMGGPVLSFSINTEKNAVVVIKELGKTLLEANYLMPEELAGLYKELDQVKKPQTGKDGYVRL